MTGSRFTRLARGRVTTRGDMNKTEARYADNLRADVSAGLISDYWFEPFSLRLTNPPSGQPARYTPDFMVLLPDGETWIIDVKGSGLDDNAARVRIKCAAERYPLWRFFIAKERRKRDGGGFEMTEV